MADQPNKPNVVEMAKKQRHIHLYEKIQHKKPLSRAELKELSNLEEKESTPEILDTQDQVAKAFGVRRRTVEYWAKDGMPVCSDGKYDIRDIQAWKFTRKNGHGGGQSADKKNLAYWDAQYREYKARKEEVLYRKHIGELVERHKIEEGLISISIAIKRTLLAVPRSVAPILAGLEPREIEKVLTEKVKETIKLFSEDKIFSGGEKEKKNDKIRKKARHLDRKSKARLGSASRHDGVPVGGSVPRP
jgi:phage terminase Nu1 subunit (DNA packaging protein)